MKELSRIDLLDILKGATVLGAGGGGDLQEGLSLIDQALDAGKTFKLASIDEVPDDALVCTPYLLGAISPLSAEEERRYSGLSRSDRHPLLLAYERFQRYLGQPFYATTACELGGSNTAVPFFCAAMNDHCVIDADPAGRAVPEITHSTYYFAGLPAAPIVAANEFGETFVLEKVIDDQRAETIVRALCQVSRNDISVIDHALEMQVLRQVLIPGTISRSMALGRVLRETKDAEGLPRQIANIAGGAIAFSGIVKAATYTTADGFTKGSIEIDGSGEHRGQTYRILVKNENLAGWLNDDVNVTIPDLICVFDNGSGQPVTNPHVTAGQSVAVVLLPAPAEFTSDKALSVFGPAYAGIDAAYRPIG
jgi:DUF917 family protein